MSQLACSHEQAAEIRSRRAIRFRSRSATANFENVKHEWESRLPG